MRSANTPEELESLLEDAFLLGDRDALASLFDNPAVLAADDGSGEARGPAEIVRLASTMGGHGYAYVASPLRVLQAGDTALVVAERAVNVMRRGQDRGWRYAISLLGEKRNTEGRQR
jgi:hypothetical protein